MKVLRHIIIYLLVFTAFVGCGSNNMLRSKMENIKEVGNSNPELAMSMLDSLKYEVSKADEHTKMLYDLLNIRLNDKAYHVASSDIISKRVTEYFEENGSEAEKQEAYYYNASVYRDLKDTPRALENFLKSAEIANKNMGLCDSIMLRNTYSNLEDLFFNVQDNKNALKFAIKEYEIAQALHCPTTTHLLKIAMSYSFSGDTAKAKMIFGKAYNIMMKDKNQNIRDIYSLILNLSYLKETSKAANCVIMARMHRDHVMTATQYIALGEYYKAIDRPDSAIIMFKSALTTNPNASNVYDATKFISQLYNKKGNKIEANKYAQLFINHCDTLDIGKRQEMAATVNNQYQYHLDRNKEMEAERKVPEYRNWAMVLALCAIVMVSLFIIFHVKRRNSQLKTLVAMSRRLESAKGDKRLLQEEIDKKNRELAETKQQYAASSAELGSVKERLDNINRQLQQSRAELKSKEDMLNSKMEQNQSFLRLLHRSELEGRADDVLEAVKKSAGSTKKMTAEDWRRLYAAVNEIHPDFRSLLTERLGRFTEQQMMVCYLVRAGLTNPQIQNLTGLPRATVWRWVKKFEWAGT